MSPIFIHYISPILICVSLLGHTAYATTTTCERIIKHAKPAQEEKPAVVVDILTRERAGQASQEESAAVREVMLKSFYGKYPVLFSLNHLVAYDKVIAKYGVQPPMKMDALPAHMSKGQKTKVWRQETKAYQSRVRAFAKRLEKMSSSERREFAKSLANEMHVSIADSYSDPDRTLIDANKDNGRKRIPPSRKVRIKAIQEYLTGFRQGPQDEAFEELVYRSLTPLSRLAIGDRLMDRVGGRRAYQVSNYLDGPIWFRGLSGAAVIGSACIASACHWWPHDDALQFLTVTGSIGAAGTFGLFSGLYSHTWISETVRLPEKIDDAVNDAREALVKRKFWREIQGPEAESQIQPSEIVQEQIAELNIKDLSSKNDYDVNDLSNYGADLQEAIRMIAEAHLNMNIEQAEDLEKITPMIKRLQSLQGSPEKLRKEISNGKFSLLEKELSSLDKRYFSDVRRLGKIRADLDLLASKLDEFTEKIDQEKASSDPSTLKLLEHRRGSLVVSKDFVKIQRSAVDLSEAKSMDNLKTVEAIRTILISERSGMAIASEQEPSRLAQLAAHLVGN
jgi:hypothetical protein